MFRLYSKECLYALHALSCLPLEEGANIRAQDLCDRSDAPLAFTRKTLQSLAKKGYLKAVSGPKGGYKLLKNPEDISLLELVKSIDGEDVFDRCVMGFDCCHDQQPCPIHPTWKKVKKVIYKELGQQTLHSLIKTKKVLNLKVETVCDH